MLPKHRPPTYPGEMLLKEFLEPKGITQLELARHLGWPYARLNEIVNGRRGNVRCDLTKWKTFIKKSALR